MAQYLGRSSLSPDSLTSLVAGSRADLTDGGPVTDGAAVRTGAVRIHQIKKRVSLNGASRRMHFVGSTLDKEEQD